MSFSRESSTESIALFDTETLTERWHINYQKPKETICVLPMVFSPDGNILAVGDPVRQNIVLLKAQTGELTATLDMYGFPAMLWFGQDSTLLLSTHNDEPNRIVMWNTTTGKVLNTLEDHTARIHNLAFAPDDNLIATTSDDGTIRIWGIPKP
jgi:WD40 repeat protein